MEQPASVTRSVLVVSDDEGLLGAVSGLEDAGYEVLYCPGPDETKPLLSPGCVGMRTGRCPLAESASAVILDLHPQGQNLFDRSDRVELIKYYLERAELLVLLEDAPMSHHGPSAPGALSMPRDAEPALIVTAVTEALGVPG